MTEKFLYEAKNQINRLLDLADEYTDGFTCIWCSGVADVDYHIEHDEDCEGEKARAFVARLP